MLSFIISWVQFHFICLLVIAIIFYYFNRNILFTTVFHCILGIITLFILHSKKSWLRFNFFFFCVLQSHTFLSKSYDACKIAEHLFNAIFTPNSQQKCNTNIKYYINHIMHKNCWMQIIHYLMQYLLQIHHILFENSK